MSLLTIVVVIVLVGVALWLVKTFIPMPRSIKKILTIVVAILLVLWLLKEFGILDSLQNIRI